MHNHNKSHSIIHPFIRSLVHLFVHLCNSGTAIVVAHVGNVLVSVHRQGTMISTSKPIIWQRDCEPCWPNISSSKAPNRSHKLVLPARWCRIYQLPCLFQLKIVPDSQSKCCMLTWPHLHCLSVLSHRKTGIHLTALEGRPPSCHLFGVVDRLVVVRNMFFLCLKASL